jgi:hypothetical protein
MFSNVKFGGSLVALACIAVALVGGRASAVTVEVAKKCEALSAKAFPPREVGNPAAGSTKGTGKAEQDYYRKCVANGGKMDDHSGREAK